MTAGLSTANLANQWLDMLRGVAFTAPSAVYIQVHTGDPGVDGTSNNPGRVRLQVTWSAASSGSLTLATCTTVSAGNETYTHASAWDASSAGTFLFSSALTSSRSSTSSYSLVLTGFGVSLSPLAA